MRPALLAAVLCLAATSTFAQQIEAGSETDRLLWCGAAFGVLAETQSARNDGIGAAASRALATEGLTRAATSLLAEGMSGESFAVLAADYAERVMAPFRDLSLSQAECEALIDG